MCRREALTRPSSLPVLKDRLLAGPLPWVNPLEAAQAVPLDLVKQREPVDLSRPGDFRTEVRTDLKNPDREKGFRIENFGAEKLPQFGRGEQKRDFTHDTARRQFPSDCKTSINSPELGREPTFPPPCQTHQPYYNDSNPYSKNLPAENPEFSKNPQAENPQLYSKTLQAENPQFFSKNPPTGSTYSKNLPTEIRHPPVFHHHTTSLELKPSMDLTVHSSSMALAALAQRNAMHSCPRLQDKEEFDWTEGLLGNFLMVWLYV